MSYFPLPILIISKIKKKDIYLGDIILNYYKINKKNLKKISINCDTWFFTLTRAKHKKIAIF